MLIYGRHGPSHRTELNQTKWVGFEKSQRFDFGDRFLGQSVVVPYLAVMHGGG
jgi:hypothetical protein